MALLTIAMMLAACSSASASSQVAANHDASSDAMKDAGDAPADADLVCTAPGPCTIDVLLKPLAIDGGDAFICPLGNDPTASPPFCVARIAFGGTLWSGNGASRTLVVDVVAPDIAYEGEGVTTGGNYDYVLASNNPACPHLPDNDPALPAALTFDVEMPSAPEGARPGCDDVGAVTVRTNIGKIPVFACPTGPDPLDTDSVGIMQAFFASMLSDAIANVLTQKTCLSPVQGDAS